MPLGYAVVERAHCHITGQITEVVQSPYTIKQAKLGTRFQMSTSLARLMAKQLGLVDRHEFDEQLDQKDAEIQDLKAQLQGALEDRESLRVPAEKYWASLSNDPAETGQKAA